MAGGGTQTPFQIAHGGTPAYDYFGKNPRLSTLFDQAMAHQSLLVIRKLLEHPKVFDGVGVIVDVGGGTGATLALIRGRYKHIKGINMDLAHVISEAPSLEGIAPVQKLWQEYVGLCMCLVFLFSFFFPCLTGVEHVAGDMFESVPSGDAVLMKVC